MVTKMKETEIGIKLQIDRIRFQKRNRSNNFKKIIEPVKNYVGSIKSITNEIKSLKRNTVLFQIFV
jgi:hypothetical protein